MKLTNVAQLDWAAAQAAATAITKLCDDAGYTPPEALATHRARIQRVCHEMDKIVTALCITPPGGAA